MSAYLKWVSRRQHFPPDIYCGDLVKLLEVTLKDGEVPPRRESPWRSLTLWVVCTELPAIRQLKFRVSYSGPGPWRGFHSWVDSLYLPLSQMLGQQFALGLPLSYRFKMSCWFFTLLSFLLDVKTECWLLSFLHTEPETGSQIYFHKMICRKSQITIQVYLLEQHSRQNCMSILESVQYPGDVPVGSCWCREGIPAPSSRGHSLAGYGRGGKPPLLARSKALLLNNHMFGKHRTS